LQSTLIALSAEGKADEIRQKQQQMNQLNTELITVKTRQEQYQAFIDNSRNRKEDIARKIATIKEDMVALQPQLAEYKTQKEIQSDLLQDKQQAFNELNEMVTVQSTVTTRRISASTSSKIRYRDYLKT
jgi:chromosome segregation protein